MRLLHAIIFSACLLLATPVSAQRPALTPAQTAEQEAYKVVEDWAAALDRNNVDEIVSKYADAPVLFFGTKSTILATTKAQVRDYFSHFVAEDRPAVSLCEHKTIEVSSDAVLFAGFYDFVLKGGPVYARYSFLIRKLGGAWLISHHHSAAQPAGAMPCLKS